MAMSALILEIYTEIFRCKEVLVCNLFSNDLEEISIFHVKQLC